MENWPSRSYSYDLPLRYRLLGHDTKRLVIILHGYQDHAVSMLRRLGWLEKEPSFSVLAVNAPFPVPVLTKAGFMEAYSWYFRDSTRGFTVCSPEDSAQRLAFLIRDLNLDATPTILLGFSQGGYLAPLLAAQLPNTPGIIGLGCGYPLEAYMPLNKISVFGIHGAKDERVALDKSHNAHAELLKAGFKGRFAVIPDLDHRVDIQMEPLIQTFVQECFS